MKAEEVLTISRVNGARCELVDVIGPLMYGDVAFWLVRAVRDGMVVRPQHSLHLNEYMVCDTPHTAELGWHVDPRTSCVHYAFAQAVKTIFQQAWMHYDDIAAAKIEAYDHCATILSHALTATPQEMRETCLKSGLEVMHDCIRECAAKVSA